MFCSITRDDGLATASGPLVAKMEFHSHFPKSSDMKVAPVPLFYTVEKQELMFLPAAMSAEHTPTNTFPAPPFRSSLSARLTFHSRIPRGLQRQNSPEMSAPPGDPFSQVIILALV